MRRFLIFVQYRGDNFLGWQLQPRGRTVEGTLNECLSKTLKSPIKVYGSGRTDSGVHAAAHAAHFDTDSPIPPERLPFAANIDLPDDVKIVECREVSKDFHARRDCIGKTYTYSMYVSRHILPLSDCFALRIYPEPDIDQMNIACQSFLGKHDFKAFRAEGSTIKTTVRYIQAAHVSRCGELIVFTVTGKGFLYNMVRIMAGTLLDVGQGKYPPAHIDEILASGDRKQAGKTLDAKGLCLLRSYYPGDEIKV